MALPDKPRDRKQTLLMIWAGADLEAPAKPARDREEGYLYYLSGADTETALPALPCRDRREMYMSYKAGQTDTLPALPARDSTEQYWEVICGRSETLPLIPRDSTQQILEVIAENSMTPTEDVTIIGVSPLVLEDAAHTRLTSLIQMGKIESDGSVLTCNNGVLTAIDDELPTAYRRITGILFDGDTWYETGEALTGDDDVTITLANTSSSGQNVFGAYSGTSAGTKNFSFYLYGGGSTNGSYLRYGEQLVRPRFGSNERTLTFGKSGTSGFATDVSITPEEFTTEAKAYIGMLPNSSSPAYIGSVIGNVLISDRLKYIPCERVSDGIIGYYETHTETFIEPSGTGTPTKGNYDTSHLNVLAIVGMPETVVITADDAQAQTLNAVNLFETDDIADEQNLVTGDVTRYCEVTVSGGVITISALDTPVAETVPAQPVTLAEGDSTITVTANVDDIDLEVTYRKLVTE